MSTVVLDVIFYFFLIFTHADSSRRVGFSPAFVCLSVCVSDYQRFSHDISKSDAAGIIKLDTEMFHHEYC